MVNVRMILAFTAGWAVVGALGGCGEGVLIRESVHGHKAMPDVGPGNVPVRILTARDGEPSVTPSGKEGFVDLVRRAFFLHDLEDVPYQRADVRVVFDEAGKPEELLVYLLHQETYLYDAAKVQLDGTGHASWAGMISDDHGLGIRSRNHCDLYCPDETVQMLFSTCIRETETPTAVAAVARAAEIAEEAGYSVRVLTGSNENQCAIMRWMTCPNLVFYGRVGHGQRHGIVVDDGVVASSWFSSLGQATTERPLAGMTMYLNSCQVHNNPFEPAVLGAGVQKFIGGNVDLYKGLSERVFVCFLERTLLNGVAMSSALGDCEHIRDYPELGAHGISGPGAETIRSPGSLYEEHPEPVGARADFTFTARGLDVQFASLADDDCSDGNDPPVAMDRFRFHLWDFGDGHKLEGVANPSHTYGTPGRYMVSLIVADQNDEDGRIHERLRQIEVFPDPNDAAAVVLANARPQTGLAASQGSWLYFKIVVPATASSLKVQIGGGIWDGDGDGEMDADADLYVQYDGKPTPESFLCRPYLHGNQERCEINRLAPGPYFVGIHAAAGFSNLTLNAKYF